LSGKSDERANAQFVRQFFERRTLRAVTDQDKLHGFRQSFLRPE
jgi:hypothetical protein